MMAEFIDQMGVAAGYTDETETLGDVARLAFIANKYGPARHLLIPGGFVPAHAFEEALWCYVNGQFIVCVLLGQVVLEPVVAAPFYPVGKDSIAEFWFKNLMYGSRKIAEHIWNAVLGIMALGADKYKRGEQ